MEEINSHGIVKYFFTETFFEDNKLPEKKIELIESLLISADKLYLNYMEIEERKEVLKKLKKLLTESDLYLIGFICTIDLYHSIPSINEKIKSHETALQNLNNNSEILKFILETTKFQKILMGNLWKLRDEAKFSKLENEFLNDPIKSALKLIKTHFKLYVKLLIPLHKKIMEEHGLRTDDQLITWIRSKIGYKNVSRDAIAKALQRQRDQEKLS